MPDPSLTRARRTIGTTAAIGLVLLWAVPAAAGLGVDYASFGGMLLAFAGVGLFWPYVAWRGMIRLQTAIETFLLSFLVALLTLVCSYSAMRLGLPLRDAYLASVDAALGVNARAVVEWVDRSPLLCALLELSYRGIVPQIVWLPVLLCLLGLPVRGFALVFGLIALCLLCSAVASQFPAHAAYVHYGIAAGDLVNIDPLLGSHFLASFDAVRDDPAFVLSAGNGSGIVTYPSGHAGAAVLCGWAAWGSRWLRWPMVVLNAAMLASAITHGAHYVIDVAAGAALAAAVAWGAARLFLAAPAAPALRLSRRAAPAAAA